MLSVDQLDEYLDKLTEYGVTAFSCPEFTVQLAPQMHEAGDEDDDVTVAEAIKRANAAEQAPRIARGLYGHPSLWPDGKMPSFPGSERATSDHKPTHPDED